MPWTQCPLGRNAQKKMGGNVLDAVSKMTNGAMLRHNSIHWTQNLGVNIEGCRNTKTCSLRRQSKISVSQVPPRPSFWGLGLGFWRCD